MFSLKSRAVLAATLALGAVFATDAMTVARAEGAWCAAAGGRNEYRNCGYASFNQCRAAVVGVGGYCQPNPAFVLVYRPH